MQRIYSVVHSTEVLAKPFLLTAYGYVADKLGLYSHTHINQMIALEVLKWPFVIYFGK